MCKTGNTDGADSTQPTNDKATTTTNFLDNDDFKVSPASGILLILWFLVLLQAILWNTYFTTLVIIASTVVLIVIVYPQPQLQWDEVYAPMAQDYIQKELQLNSNKEMIVAITGATSGIGLELARLLTKKSGITVIAIGRSPTKLSKLQQESPELIQTVICDLTDLESVSKACAEIKERFEKLDVLINNAGIQLGMENLWKELSSSKQGYDLVFGVNYLSHFLLTEKLIPLLQKSKKPKLVQISSSYHWTVDGNDLRPPPQPTDDDDNKNKNKDSKYYPVAAQIGGSHGFVVYRGIRQYANSKLAQILHARALQRRFGNHQNGNDDNNNNNNKKATPIQFVSACPAWVGTQIAGQEGSFIHTGFVQLAYPVNGHGINSFVHAIFDQNNANQKYDFYTNTTVTNPNVMDLMPSWMSHVLPLRDTVGSIIAFTLLPFQRMIPAVLQTNPSSRASYNVELQESLYEWSMEAVKPYL